LILLFSLHYPSSVIDDFSGGTFNQTYYNGTIQAVQINLSMYISGNYTSEIFNGGSSAAEWLNISWILNYTTDELNPTYDTSLLSGLVGLWHLNTDYPIGSTYLDKYRSPDMQMLFHFEEASGNFNDYSGNGYTGVQTGFDVSGDYRQEGKFNYGIAPDNGEYITLNTGVRDALADTDQFTIMFWHKPGDITGDERILGYTTSWAANGQWLIWENGNTLVFQMYNNSLSPFNAYVTPANKWIHYAWVWNKNDARLLLYVNGVLNSNASATGMDISDKTNPILLAGVDTADNIDELVIYNRSLSQSEISYWANKGLIKDSSSIGRDGSTTSLSPLLYDMEGNLSWDAIDGVLALSTDSIEGDYSFKLTATNNDAYFRFAQTVIPYNLSEYDYFTFWAKSGTGSAIADGQFYFQNLEAGWPPGCTWYFTYPENWSKITLKISDGICDAGVNLTNVGYWRFDVNTAGNSAYVDKLMAERGNIGNPYNQTLSYPTSKQTRTSFANDLCDETPTGLSVSIWMNKFSGTSGMLMGQTKDWRSLPRYGRWIVYCYNLSASPSATYSCNSALDLYNGTDWLDIQLSFGAMNINTWYNLVFTWDRTTKVFNTYKNGVFQNTVLSADWPLGCGSNDDWVYFLGDYDGISTINASLDEVAIWNREISATEVMEVYKKGATRFNISVRSCNDELCDGEDWTYAGIRSPFDLSSLSTNHYFQYKTEFWANSTTVSPFLYSTIIDYIGGGTSEIAFVFPTLDSNETVSGYNYTINTTINETNLKEVYYTLDDEKHYYLDDNYILRANFDNIAALGEPTSLVKDISSNNYTGTVYGTIGYSPAEKGSGLNFSKQKYSYVYWNNEGAPIEDQSFMISAWVNAQNPNSGWRNLIFYGTGQSTISLYVRWNRVMFEFWDTSGARTYAYTTPNVLNESTFNFITAVRDTENGRALIYINGELKANFTDNTNNCTFTSAIRTSEGYDNGYFNGTIDELSFRIGEWNIDNITKDYYGNLYKYDPEKYYLEINQTSGEGIHEYLVCAVNIFGGEVCTETRNITLDNTPPSITVINPEQGRIYTGIAEIPYLNLTSPDATNCSHSWNYARSDYMHQSGTMWYLSTAEIGISSGNHTSQFHCVDELGNYNYSEYVYWGIDLTPPQISLSGVGSPVGTYITNGTDLNHNYTVYCEGVGCDTCKLYGNWTGSWEVNQTETTITEGVEQTFYLNATDGDYYWGVWCNGTDGQEGFSEYNYSYIVSTSEPTIAITNPVDLENYTELQNIINYTFTSGYPDACWYVSGNETKYFTCGEQQEDVFSQEGENSLSVYLTDLFGREASHNITYNVNLTHYNFSIYILSPENNSVLTNPTVNFTLTTSSEGDICVYSLDDWATNTSMDKQEDNLTFTHTDTIAYGAHSAGFYCNSSNGLNDTQIINFTIVSLYDINFINDSMFYLPDPLLDQNWSVFNATINVTTIEPIYVNLSLFMDDSIVNSSLLYFADDEIRNVSLGWLAQGGNYTATLAADYSNDFTESNETDNNISVNAFVYKVAKIEILSPLNNSYIVRGGGYTSDTYREDPVKIVSNFTTIIARAYNIHSYSESINATCYFYFDNVLLGNNETGEDGNCSYSFDHTLYDAGSYQLFVNFTPAYYALLSETDISVEFNETINVITSYILPLNDRGLNDYKVGDAIISNVSFKNDSNYFDPYNFTLFIVSDNVIDCANPDPADIFFILQKQDAISNPSTGVYLLKSVLNGSQEGSNYVRWCLHVNDSSGNYISSYQHSDYDLDPETANITVSALNSSGDYLSDANLILNDRNGYNLINQSISSQTTIPASLEDNYTLLEISDNTNKIIFTPLNATLQNTSIEFNFIYNYSDALPYTGIGELKSFVYLKNSSFFTYGGTANITLEKEEGTTIRRIYKCEDYSEATQTCSEWNLSFSISIEQNTTHYWFEADSFSGYAGGELDGANLTIWDSNDSGMPYGDHPARALEQIYFYANYTNATDGTLITDEIEFNGSCIINFSDTADNPMIYNSTKGLYEYNRSFDAAGLQYWNVTCNSSIYAILTAEDNVTVGDANIAPSISIEYPTEGLNLSINVSIELNFTVSDPEGQLNISSCFYTLDDLTPINIENCLNTTFNVSLNTEGRHNISVSASDTEGGSNTSNLINFSIDLSNPSLTIEIPQEGYNYTSGIITLNFTAYDEYTAINTSKCTYIINGNEHSIPDCNNLSSIEDLTNGTNNLNVTVWDIVGHSNTSDTISFTIDDSYPNITIEIPQEGYNYSSNSLTLNFTALNEYTTVQYCNYTLNDAEYEISDCNNMSGGTIQGLTNGTNYLNITAWNMVGSSNTSDTVEFLVDDIGPSISIEVPQEGYNYTSTILTLNFTTSDSLTSVQYCNYTINDNEYEIENCNNISAGLIQGLQNGTNNLNITAWDILGNSNTSDTIQFTIDDVNPSLTIEIPQEGYNYTSNTITLNYTAFDQYTSVVNCSYTINMAEYNIPSCVNLSSDLIQNLQNGTNSLFVKVYDAMNNSNTSDTISFTIDDSYPNITIEIPQEGYNYSSNSLTLNFTALNEYTTVQYCNYTLNDAEYEISDCNNMSGGTIQGLTNGTNYLNITAWNMVGSSNTSDTVEFLIDDIPPVYNLDNLSPADLTTTTDRTPEFAFNVTDNYFTTLSCELLIDSINYGSNSSVINGTITTITAGSALSGGSHLWSISCSDDVGNSNSTPQRTITINVPSSSSSSSSKTKTLELYYTFNCSNGVLDVNATEKIIPVENAKIILLGLDFYLKNENTTNKSGIAGFNVKNNGRYRIISYKEGYFGNQLSELNFELCPEEIEIEEIEEENITKIEEEPVVEPTFECQLDSDCKNEEYCLDGYCLPVTGSCGYVLNHEWAPYECCLDLDCSENQFCENYKCVEKKENPPIEEDFITKYLMIILALIIIIISGLAYWFFHSRK